jgi:large subunit ribosomal protein L25
MTLIAKANPGISSDRLQPGMRLVLPPKPDDAGGATTRPSGAAAGTHEGGIIEQQTGRLEIECLVTDIPEKLVVSVKDVHVGGTLHAGDIELPDGISLVSSPNTLLVTCHLVTAAKTTEEVEEEMPSAPEVIGEVKEPEAGEAQEE